jgi:hypothetical protein
MRSIILSSRFNAPVAKLYPHYNELEKFGNLHPLITKVTPKGNNTFLINENLLLLGFIPMKPEYSAEVIEKDGKIFYYSKVKKNVDLEISFSFKEENGTTVITEEVKVEGNALVAAILLKTIRKAHSEIFIRLRKLVNTQ